jgi:hypothetical protein
MYVTVTEILDKIRWIHETSTTFDKASMNFSSLECLDKASIFFIEHDLTLMASMSFQSLEKCIEPQLN